jgi:hypothetical protein
MLGGKGKGGRVGQRESPSGTEVSPCLRVANLQKIFFLLATGSKTVACGIYVSVVLPERDVRHTRATQRTHARAGQRLTNAQRPASYSEQRAPIERAASSGRPQHTTHKRERRSCQNRG